MIDQGAYDRLKYAEQLLSHRLTPGDLTAVFKRGLEVWIGELEKTKFAATARPRQARRPTSSRRHIPAEVKRAVWERDGGRCTFVSEKGTRCPARHFLEFDHMDPVARGGRATVERMRLRCWAHNQYEAECVFGAEFMKHKREAARQAAEEQRAARTKAPELAAAAARQAEAVASEQAKENDVIPWLRQLGFRADEARRAAALSDSIPDAPLEERVRVALSYFRPRTTSHGVRRAASSPGMAPQPV